MSTSPDLSGGIVLSPAQIRARRVRNVAIGLLIGGLALLFYMITIAKLGSRAFNMFDGI